jgi:catechol 2,3-dioxygenase-like lactoylglutathione lyase family enzyme
MADASPVFDQINLVVKDMDASLAFYRRLGLTISEPPVWPPGTGARHAEVAMPSGVRLEFDNYEMVRIWHPSWSETQGRGRIVLGFSMPSREAVDARYAELVSAGHGARHAPHDAFWGSRYAIVHDPDGNDVGLMSPPDAKHGSRRKADDRTERAQ